jgi:branched-chain amino acid aminotransferase
MGFFDMYTADEVFVTGTAAEIAPITKIDGRSIADGKPGKITKMLMSDFKELTKTAGTPIA